jgi:hypothetical protein
VQELHLLRARYCRYVDTKQWDALDELVTPDFSLSSDGMEHHGRAEVRAFVVGALEHAATVHHVHQPEITFTDDDHASGIWAMNDYVIFPTDPPFMIRGWGHYHDEYVRTDAGWRFSKVMGARLRVETEGELPVGLGGPQESERAGGQP